MIAFIFGLIILILIIMAVVALFSAMPFWAAIIITLLILG